MITGCRNVGKQCKMCKEIFIDDNCYTYNVYMQGKRETFDKSIEVLRGIDNQVAELYIDCMLGMEKGK